MGFVNFQIINTRIYVFQIITAITAILLISAFYFSFFVMDIFKFTTIFQETNTKVSRKELPKIKEEIKVKPV